MGWGQQTGGQSFVGTQFLSIGSYKKKGRLETRSASRHQMIVENAFVSQIRWENL